jgi:hypothetical protein
VKTVPHQPRLGDRGKRANADQQLNPAQRYKESTNTLQNGKEEAGPCNEDVGCPSPRRSQVPQDALGFVWIRRSRRHPEEVTRHVAQSYSRSTIIQVWLRPANQ